MTITGYPFSMRIVLIRVRNGKALVVAGPLKRNQLTPQNSVPEIVSRLIDKADSIELYSLDPQRTEEKGGFHGWQILGKTQVKAAKQREQLGSALRLGAEDNFGMAAGCFNPRHGLRLKGDGKTVDLVICFECLSVQVFVDGRSEKGFLTTGDPQTVYDATLKAANVKLAQPAE